MILRDWFTLPRHFGTILALAMLAACLGPPPAAGLAFLDLTSSISAFDTPQTAQFHDSVQVNQPGPSLSVDHAITTPIGSATASGFVEFGRMGATVFASAISNGSGATFFGRSGDEVIVFGNPGDVVPVRFTISSNFSTACSGGGSVFARAYVSAGGMEALSFTDQCNSTLQETKSIVAGANVGDPLEFFLHYELVANSGTIGSALIDPPVFLAIELVDAGGSFTTASGADYSSDLAPVPEPATLLLFGTTTAALGLARWRQRRRKQQAEL